MALTKRQVQLLIIGVIIALTISLFYLTHTEYYQIQHHVNPYCLKPDTTVFIYLDEYNETVFIINCYKNGWLLYDNDFNPIALKHYDTITIYDPVKMDYYLSIMSDDE